MLSYNCLIASKGISEQDRFTPFNHMYVDKIKWTSPVYTSGTFKSSLDNMKPGLKQR